MRQGRSGNEACGDLGMRQGKSEARGVLGMRLGKSWE